MDVWARDEAWGESWGAIGGICVPEALELMTEHRNGNYILRRGGRVGGAGTQAKWLTRDIVRMRRVVHFPDRHCCAVGQVVWVSNRALRILDFTLFCFAETNRVGPLIFPVWT